MSQRLRVLMLAWRPVVLTHDVREDAWELEDRFSLSWWDTPIVAAARVAGCRYLSSEDMQDGLVIDAMQICDPFVHPLAELGLDDP